MSATEQTGDNEVTFRFNQSGNRELPQIVGQIPVLSKAWWTGKNDKGETRDINSTTLEAPLGNGAYRIAEVKPGTSITLKRNDDYWGGDLPVNRGQEQFRRDLRHLLPRQHHRNGGLQGRRVRLPRREFLQGLGNLLRLPGSQARRRDEGGNLR